MLSIQDPDVAVFEVYCTGLAELSQSKVNFCAPGPHHFGYEALGNLKLVGTGAVVSHQQPTCAPLYGCV
ncbi:MAG TPA: hypothetical protein VIY49_05955 [Bryobacteraceae bacterium]